MNFLTPWGLLLLIPVAIIAITYLLTLRRRSKYAVRFAALPMLDRIVPERPAWRRHVPAAALLLAFVTLGLAAARPEVAVQVPRERATVIIAIDTSASMQATDVAPSRMAAAVAAASDFIDDLPNSFDVGVVAFSGSAAVIAPPNTDHAAAIASLQNLLVSSSTALGEAVFTSLDAIASVDDVPVDPRAEQPAESVPARIVLLSDGSNTAGRPPAEAAQASSDNAVPVSTIAYGTPNGMLDNAFGGMPVPVDTETLSGLAEQTGGLAYTAQSSDELEDVYRDIGASIGYRTEYREITMWLMVLGLSSALAAAAMSMRWFARML
ncbi:VWA domain-containing protein [Rhodococcus sp. 15-649-2-2]|uniref:VWA domain-containing protein n=1 Tax=Rhodococcus sp. 15-649-2-2 TaxID=2023140 RepID=UPI000B9B3B4C|nr:VWA domain-containing protein [Rhodococcus sp. 15-649-2-2]OZE87832.1 VWA domain-containing protein [Rhodococcus sp. 15-649-2-2]